MEDCLLCQMVRGEVPCHKIFETPEHLAFLSIYPNTRGFSVVLPKAHYPSYAFDLPDDILAALVLAAKQVGQLLDQRLPGVGRTGLILEGFGVNHAHAKLFPMYGTAAMREWHPIKSTVWEYFQTYEGYMSSHDGERADDTELARLAAQIRGGPERVA
jgi:histidine triad (HIT) family protein